MSLTPRTTPGPYGVLDKLGDGGPLPLNATFSRGFGEVSPEPNAGPRS